MFLISESSIENINVSTIFLNRNWNRLRCHFALVLLFLRFENVSTTTSSIIAISIVFAANEDSACNSKGTKSYENIGCPVTY